MKNLEILRKVKFQGFVFWDAKRTLSDKIKYTTIKLYTERSVLMFKDYNMNQLTLPLDLELKYPRFHVFFLFVEFH
jgi:hypothetical protein